MPRGCTRLHETCAIEPAVRTVHIVLPQRHHDSDQDWRPLRRRSVVQGCNLVAGIVAVCGILAGFEGVHILWQQSHASSSETGTAIGNFAALAFLGAALGASVVSAVLIALARLVELAERADVHRRKMLPKEKP